MSRSEALKQAQARYRKRIKRVEIRFSEKDIDLYNELIELSEKAGLSPSDYIKAVLQG